MWLQFRHFANKLGNLERPFLKDFFPRWVESSGCPRLRLASKSFNLLTVHTLLLENQRGVPSWFFSVVCGVFAAIVLHW